MKRHLTRLYLLGLTLLLSACLRVPALFEAPSAPPAPSTPTSTPHAQSPTSLDGTSAPTTTPISPPPASASLFARLNDSQILIETLRPEAGMAPESVADLTRYDMTVSLEEDLSAITGAAAVRYTNREQAPLDVLYLHLFPNLWDGQLQVTDVTAAGVPAAVTWPSGDDILGVRLPSPLMPDETINLSLSFAMDVPSGDGVGNYGEFAYQEGILALAHFYPTLAVYDTDWRLETPSSQGDVIYNDASLYDVTLIAPADLKVASTGAEVDSRDLPDGRKAWHLVGGPMRDFNIVASADYESEARQVNGVEVISHFLPEDRSGGQLALKYAADAVRIFQDAFGPYPYRELDVVATATEAGGIEYPGMIVVARALYDAADPTSFFQAATAHEVAHQWWYNVVGNDQINDPWLDEATAQYATQLYYGEIYGLEGADAFRRSLDDRWARVDYEAKPVGLPVAAYEDREYGAIVYGRGPLFLIALRDRIGADKMSELLRRHYAENRWGIATPEGFQALAEEVSGEDLNDLFNEWVYEADGE
jgi:hypothetical protein